MNELNGNDVASVMMVLCRKEHYTLETEMTQRGKEKKRNTHKKKQSARNNILAETREQTLRNRINRDINIHVNRLVETGRQRTLYTETI